MKIGEGIAKKPMVPILVVLLVTFASLGMIAMDPPSFDMDEGSFTPHNDVTKASTLMSEVFTSSATAMALVDTKDTDAGDIFTRQTFLDLLDFEMQLATLTYTDADGDLQPYAALPGFTIVSPIASVAEVFTSPLFFNVDLPVPTDYSDPVEYQIAYYTTLKDVIGLNLFELLYAVSDSMIKMAAYGVFTDPSGAMLLSLLSNDAVIEGGSASARGCMITMMVNDDALEMIKDGQLGFERDVISAANDFIPDTDGLSISSIGLLTTMNEIDRKSVV